MRKVVFLLLHLGYGGIETSTINTVNVLSKDYDIELIVFYNLKNNQADLLNEKIKVKYLYNGEPNKKEFLDSIKKLNFFSTIKESLKAVSIIFKKKYLVIKEIKKLKPFAIVSTRVQFSVLLNKYGNNNTIKIVQEHHHHNNNKKYINKLKYKYKRIDFLFALTKGLKKDYETFLMNYNSHTKVCLVPNMLNFVSDQKSLLKNSNIISVGRLHVGKRIDELVQIFSKIKNKKSKLFIIGKGEEEKKIIELITALNLQNRILMLGYLTKEQQKEYYLKASVFAMTSISEGLPMVLLEAMDYGLPCIAYKTETGVGDIINNKNGIIIKNRNEQKYIQKLNELLDNKKILKNMSIEAKKTAEYYYGENIVKIWNEILNISK